MAAGWGGRRVPGPGKKIGRPLGPGPGVIRPLMRMVMDLPEGPELVREMRKAKLAVIHSGPRQREMIEATIDGLRRASQSTPLP